MSEHLHVVSMSGGKDSTCTVLLCLEREQRDRIRFVFADTGNEHEVTMEYLDYLEDRLDIEILRLRADFSEEFARKRKYMIEKWPGKGVPQAVVDRAVELLVPSGIPFLDLCMLKGRFPSRLAQFCTQRLKTEMLVDYQINLSEGGNLIWSWQGVRAAESANRALLPPWDDRGGGIINYRPIVRGWSVDMVFAKHDEHGVMPNPLYKQGQSRVGCMPCIHESKEGLSNINKRWPEHIDRIEEWERIVGGVSRRGVASFFPSPDDGRGELRGRDVRTYVQWAQTSRGGRQFDLLKVAEPPAACSSSYGLCE